MNRILGAAVVVALVLWLAPARAHAQSAPTCSYNSSNGVITVNVDGNAATMTIANNGALRLNGANCGIATVDNTDTININGGPRPDTVTIKGWFIPGATTEIGGQSEIEINFDLGGGSDTVKVNLTEFQDTLVFSTGGMDVRNDGDQDITTAGVETLRVYGLGSGDTIDGSAYQWGKLYLYGGGGDDTLVGSPAGDYLYGQDDGDGLMGGPGNDKLFGGAGNDGYFGDEGNDALWADASSDGSDEFYGGDGTDTVNYSKRTNPLTVTVGNGLFDDGETDEFDLIDFDVETINGGAGNDVMTGNTFANTLNGGLGDDQLHGGTGDDTLNGGDGADTLSGDGGNDALNGGLGDDELRGYAGNDTMYGGDGADILIGGTGLDLYFGEGGDDFMTNRDGIAETIECGDGVDSAQNDGASEIYNSCEIITNPAGS